MIVVKVILSLIYYRFQVTYIMQVLILTIISLVMPSRPGAFFSLSLVNLLASSSYEIGESLTGGISSGSPIVLSCGRVSL